MSDEQPTADELRKLYEAALVDMGRDALAALKKHGFDSSSDEQVFDLVERAVADHGLVALAVIHENRVLVIKYIPDGRGVAVIPCADAGQVGRAALEYGDEMARGSIRFASSH